MELNDPIDIFAVKVLGCGMKLDFNATQMDHGKWLPDRGELMLEVSFLVTCWRKVWYVRRRR